MGIKSYFKKKFGKKDSFDAIFYGPKKLKQKDEITVRRMVDGLKTIYRNLEIMGLSEAEKENFIKRAHFRLKIAEALTRAGYDSTKPYHNTVVNYFLEENDAEKRKQYDYLVTELGTIKFNTMAMSFNRKIKSVDRLFGEAYRRYLRTGFGLSA